MTAASSTASLSSPALTVTVCSSSQSLAVNVSFVWSTDTSVEPGTFTLTVTAAVGCDVSTTV